VRVEAHPLRLTEDNAAALIGRYDLVVDCSDNFRTKFLINDAAVLAHKPAVFASVYQYEGQLQIYKPAASHACLRCLWPTATADGTVGNCAEAGVLGPVPGILGSLEALLALKVLLDLPGQLGGELWLLDFTTFDSVKLKAPRRAACTAPGCELIRELAAAPAAVDLDFDSLELAARLGFEVIDIRDAGELVQRQAAGRHLPMAALLAEPGVLPATGRYLLVCATGRRSAAAARSLRARGLQAASLSGGLQRLDAAAAAAPG
jgi:adenylyltransferase/sulfurtransferase